LPKKYKGSRQSTKAKAIKESEWFFQAWFTIFAKIVISLFTPMQSIPMTSKMSVVDVMLFRQDTLQQESW
jgi:hypothetical protein